MSPVIQALLSLGTEGIGKLGIGMILPQLKANGIVSDKALAMLAELPTSTQVNEVPLPMLGSILADAFATQLQKNDNTVLAMDEHDSVFEAGHAQVCKLCFKPSWYHADERLIQDGRISVTCHHCDEVTTSKQQ